MSDKSTGKDKLHGSNDHVEKHDIWQEISGRIWQGALIAEGVFGGAAAELAAGKAMTTESLTILGGGAVSGALLGAVMGSKREAVKMVVGGIGALAGGAFTVMEGFKYANDKQLAKALDAVYKHQDWQTFNKQTKTAEKVFGHEGLNLMLGGASGAIGMAAGMKFAPGLTRHFSPKTAEFFYGKDKLEVLGANALVKVMSSDKVEGGYAHRAASDVLADLGVFPGDFNRAAACNKHIQAMNADKQIEAIRAVSYYLQGHPEEYGLPLAQRIPALNEMGRKLTPSQIEVLTNRVADFDAGNFPHHLFDAPFMKSVDSLVSSGMISNATKAHKLLSKLVTNSLNRESIETGELFVRCAKNLGISDEDLLRKEMVATAGQLLRDLQNERAKVPAFPNLIPEIARALKLLGGETRFKHVTSLSEMRGRGFDLNDITAESLKDYVNGFRPYLR